MNFSKISPGEYLRGKNIDYREENGELVFKCIFAGCDEDSRGNEAHVWMNAETGQYQCKKCGTEGNLIILSKHFGDRINEIIRDKPLTPKPKKVFDPEIVETCHRQLPAEIRQYLNNRGLTDDVIDKSKLGWWESKVGNRISIPVGDEDGVPIYLKLRQDPNDPKKGNKYIFYPGGNASLFGVEFLKNEKDRVFICEGEFDCMLLQSKGMTAVTSTAGAGTFKPEWVDKFADKKEVYIVFDLDKEGQDGMQKVAEKLSAIKTLSVFTITLTEEVGAKGDLTDFFTKFNGTVERLLELSRPFVKTEVEEKVEEKTEEDDIPIESFEHETKEHVWIIEKKKLQIRKKFDGKVVFSDTFKVECFWEYYDNQEKVGKAITKVGICPDKKTAEDLVAEIFSEIRTNWKVESKEEKEIKKQEAKVSQLILDRPIALKEVHEAVALIGMYPKDMFEVIGSVILSAHLKIKPPLWLMVIGNPSSIKTELVKLFDPLSGAFLVYVDSMTENAFCSGFLPSDGSDPNDLLPILDGKCFIVKDYTTLFSLNDETLKKILGDMTSIFDEDFSKFTATRGSVEYSSLFSQIGCITPAVINKHQRYMNQLGARFLSYRVPDLSEEDEKAGFAIAWSDTKGISRKEIVKKAKIIASSFLYQLFKKAESIKLKTESDEVKRKINNLARFVARARGTVITKPAQFTNKVGKVVNYYEVMDIQVEQPWRAFQQLRELARCLAIVREKDEVGEEELETIRKVAISSMPTDRAKVLAIFARKREIDSMTLSEESGMSYRTAQRMLKELVALKILNKIREDQTKKVDDGYKFMHFPVDEFEEILLGNQAKGGDVPIPSQNEELEEPMAEEEIDVETLF